MNSHITINQFQLSTLDQFNLIYNTYLLCPWINFEANSYHQTITSVIYLHINL